MEKQELFPLPCGDFKDSLNCENKQPYKFIKQLSSSMHSFVFCKILIISFLCVFFQMIAFGNEVLGTPIFPIIPIQNDTLPKPSKYQGYRLYITQIKVEKETNNWVRIKFTAINTGEKEVDFGQKGREHWVQVLFDDSIRSSKLGGFRDNIRQGLYNANFKLSPGKVATNQEIKFSKILEWSQPKEKESETDVIVLSPKVVENPIDETKLEVELLENQEKCPDLVFSNIKIVETGKKHVVVEYSIKNIGKGPALLQMKEKGKDVFVGIQVFLSGAPVVSRASKELGRDVLRVPYYKKEFYPDEEMTQQIKVQTKDKTAFLKHLVLQIDSYQLMQECDRRNNEAALELK